MKLLFTLALTLISANSFAAHLVQSATLDCTVAGVRKVVTFRPFESVELSMVNSAGEGLVIDASYENAGFDSSGNPAFMGRRTFNLAGNYTDYIDSGSQPSNQSISYKGYDGKTRTASCKLKDNARIAAPNEAIAPMEFRKVEINVLVP